MCWSAWELHREHGAIEHPHTRRLGGSCHTRPAGQPSPGHLACAKTLKSPVCPFLPDGTMSEQNQAPIQPQDENQLIAERREKLKALRAGQAQGRGVAFPNDFKPRDHAASLQQRYGSLAAEALETENISVSLGGRMMLKRVMGKASFATLQDGSLGDTGGRIQLYVTRDAVGEEVYADFKRWDLGDILGAEGTLFRTKTGELSIKVTSIRLLTKALRPLPDKFHGMTDQEQKYRQR